MKTEVLVLVGLVLLVDALFVAGYYLFGLARSTSPAKLGYTAAWTAVTLVIIIRGLTRIRALRRGR